MQNPLMQIRETKIPISLRINPGSSKGDAVKKGTETQKNDNQDGSTNEVDCSEEIMKSTL